MTAAWDTCARVAVTGSIATDQLLTYPGRFADQLIADRLDHVSLSFLADDLEVRPGGVAANIAYGLGKLGLRPLLVGAAGRDFDEHAARLRGAGVDLGGVRVSETRHTARFICTTDRDQNQIATFYAGAMAEAHTIDIAALATAAGGFRIVHIGADDPRAMLRHTGTCRALAIPFAADPSQQLAGLAPEECRQLVDGASLLFTNEYEAGLLRKHSGWSEGEVLRRVGTWITTLGADGVTVARRGSPPLRLPAAPVPQVTDPTGAGDAFRAGFLAGHTWDWPPERAARLGCALAARALQTVGTQEYEPPPNHAHFPVST
ncbi:carbohydrate kinase family protein [Streptomyces sp. NPDC059063]|uniref:carbohydrate kinase family protein n=1 Tax=unclassified Streptomyces TaxID=2593676 RepID=UPI0036C37E6B